MKFGSTVFSTEPLPPRAVSPGLHNLNTTNLFPASQAATPTRKFLFNDPTIHRQRAMTAPSRPRTTDSVDTYRVQKSRHHLDSSIEQRHKAVLSEDRKAFWRSKGELSEYLEMAHSQSDMLVWQRGQDRPDAPLSPLNQLSSRPKTEVYDVPDWSMANTERSANSPLLTHRHRMASMKRSRSEIRHASRSRADRLTTASASHRSIREDSPQGTELELLRFERLHYQKVNLNDLTKDELIRLIQDSGLEVPGEMKWDPDRGQMVKERCKKEVYLDYCRKKFSEEEPQPMVRVGRKLRISGIHCIVSIFKAAHGAVRILAYHDETCAEYQCLLIPPKFLDLDLKEPPSSTDTAEWREWSRVLVPRLELTRDGSLKVGTPPLCENGLPADFSLVGSHRLDSKATRLDKLEEPSRLHVTLFFDKL